VFFVRVLSIFWRSIRQERVNGVFYDKSKVIMSTPRLGKKRAMNLQCTYERVRLVRLPPGTYAVNVDVINRKEKNQI